MTGLRGTTAAVLVVYRHLHPLTAALARLRDAVGTVVVVDNHESGLPALHAEAAAAGADLLRHGNEGLLAGAYNHAVDWLRRERPQVRQVLFVDEDSDAAGVAAFLDDPGTAEVLARPGTAAVSAAYRDRATGLRARYLQLTRWGPRYLPREFGGLRPVAFVINSMSLWRLDALARLGPYDTALGLDHIDTDACLRARRQGLAVYVHGDHEFLHAIGERTRFTLLGIEMQAGGHGAARRRDMARNTAWLLRRELWREPGFAMLCLSRLAYEAVGILAVETAKLRKLAALARGVLAGLRGGAAR